MRTLRIFLLCVFLAPALQATIFGVVRGVVHDPHHMPIASAKVVLKGQNSEYEQETETNEEGEFRFDAVPAGNYAVHVSVQSFQPAEQDVTVLSNSAPIMHFEMQLAALAETVQVSGQANSAITESATPETTVTREEIAETPGADRTNSLAMITDYVPGAYLTHDQLHMRGGHQLDWLIDGVSIPNTNIASNVGPQIDPKDIDSVEVQRGSYAADYGDRTYGVFDVTPRTGFERDRQAEVVMSAGNFWQTNDQITFGDHTERFAYYASLEGNRSNLGLETPVAAVVHDNDGGLGGFGTLIFNVNARNQLRLVISSRGGFYQVPYDPRDASQRLRDVEKEDDGLIIGSWVRTMPHGMLLTVSPFYHHNRTHYDGDPNDVPLSVNDDHASGYAGLQATLGIVAGKHNARVGFYGFGQRDDQVFGLIASGASLPGFPDREGASGQLESLFGEEQYKITSWLALNGGVRLTHFSGGAVASAIPGVSENDASPRAGVSLRAPKLNWVFRGFYGHFYQEPPLITVSGPLIQFCNSMNCGFIPLHGERDEESQFGVTIPWKGWTIDADTFQTRARNFLDHNNVGNSNVFFPLTIDAALIRGWELTLRSPRLAHRAQVYLTYSNQIAQGRGAVTGGLTDFAPPTGYFLLDHDQRNTLHAGGTVNLPWRSHASTAVYYGSGFTNGNPSIPGDHLQPHTTFDLALGKDIRENVSASLNILNVTDVRLLLDNSATFGGTHFLDPREIYAEVRYRFHY